MADKNIIPFFPQECAYFKEDELIIKYPRKERYNPNEFRVSKEIEDVLRRIGNDPKTWEENNSPSTRKEAKKETATEILAPLDEVFLEDALKDDIVVRLAIPELLEGTLPGYSGVILYGPPGTGKTALTKAVGEVYTNAGAYVGEVSTSEINEALVGKLAKNLEEKIKEATSEAAKRKIHSFLSFDEGSILAEKASVGAYSVARHYQEAIDVLKRYVGNDRSFVIAISTNTLPAAFEDALVREGRLTPFFIGYPDAQQKARMWKHFAHKYIGLDITEDQAGLLSGVTSQEQGAFIEEFCRNYSQLRRGVILREKGYTTLIDALKDGKKVTEAEVKESITVDQIYHDLEAYVQVKYARLENGQERREKIGFR